MTTLPPIIKPLAAILVVVGAFVCAAPVHAGQSAQSMYTSALSRERQLRANETRVTLARLRSNVRAYEAVVRRFPRSGYSDNALWQAANLSLLAFERFQDPADRSAAARLMTRLKEQYPASPLVPRAVAALRQIEVSQVQPAAVVQSGPAPESPADVVPAAAAVGGNHDPRPPVVRASSVVTIKDIRRSPLPDGVRVSIEMDGESLFRVERLEAPKRVFFDLRGTRASPSLQDATLRFDEDIVREIRLGRHPNQTTRVVMDMEAAESYSVFTLYNPFRLVVDFQRGAADAVPAATAGSTPAPALAARAESGPLPAGKEPVPLIARPAAPSLPSPSAPVANSNGQFSMARQLGLGVARIVLDAGHGGHDPGARANGLSEADLVLDVTLRLRALLEKEPGIEVTLTRDSDVFVPLEERTAIANRNDADLFLSIHANASRNLRARGIETYFLNFASNPEAEAVAARENFGSSKTMRNLPDIVRAIALNNKIDESRDFAQAVQKAMIRRLSTRHTEVRDLGVKQAPFVVLIGAGMPSVLAEISFVTNKQDAALLKTSAYRQQIAEALFEAVMRYQRSLKGVRAVAARE